MHPVSHPPTAQVVEEQHVALDHRLQHLQLRRPSLGVVGALDLADELLKVPELAERRPVSTSSLRTATARWVFPTPFPPVKSRPSPSSDPEWGKPEQYRSAFSRAAQWDAVHGSKLASVHSS